MQSKRSPMRIFGSPVRDPGQAFMVRGGKFLIDESFDR